MKKKIIIIGMLILACFLTGCEGNEKNNKTGQETNNSTEEELKLYSDDTKYVFELANTKYVFYYKGDEITAYHTYVDYESKETASTIFNTLKMEEYPEAKKFYVKGKYIVFEWNESEYKDYKASELQTVYSYMKEVKK